MSIELVSDKGLVAVWETEDFIYRKKGEWIHLSDEGLVCFICGKVAPFVWVDSPYKWEDNPNRCELKSNEKPEAD